MLTSSLVAVILLLTSPLIVISNLLIISVWTRFKRLRTPSNTLIASLAFADLGFGIFLPVAVTTDLSSLPENYIENVTFPQEVTPLWMENSTQNQNQSSIQTRVRFSTGPFCVLLMFCAASLMSTTVIAMDRFTSVAQPLRYNHFVTASYCHRLIFILWLYSFSLAFLPFIVVKNTSLDIVVGAMSIILYLPCLVTQVTSYSYIYFVARSHARAIYSVEVSLNNSGVCEITDTSSMHHSRYGFTLALILGSLIICWIPIQICSALDLFLGANILIQHRWRVLAAAPIVLSSLINPWLYGYRSSEIRFAVVRLVDSIMRKVTGKPPSFNLLYNHYNKDLTSCGSNVRLLGASPTHTTIHCCASNGGGGGMSLLETGRKQSEHLMLCEQVSTL